MKKPGLLLSMLALTGLLTPQSAAAQCFGYFFPFVAHSAARPDSVAVDKPFKPGRWGAYMGFLGTQDRTGTAYLGADLEGGYRLTPRWTSGLRGTLTNSIAARPTSMPDRPTVERPLFNVYGATWTNSLLIIDGPRWRLAPMVGFGMGWINLRDRDRPVPQRGTQGCGCTEPARLATTNAPITEAGLALTYKLRHPDAPWLTIRGHWRQWHGSVPFGGIRPATQYLLSIGVSLPDKAPGR